jgi:ADP-L-glycero-D-manno-heptose 6-epimerase
MMRDNFDASKRVARACVRRRLPLVYASSAAVYGAGAGAAEDARAEQPLNPYAWSKLLFDRWVERSGLAREIPVAGLRYFNVYGPRESHKGKMASLALQLHRQVVEGGVARLFAGSHGVGDGEQRRDFVHVADVADVVLFFLDHPEHRGLFNVGTGEARSFLDLARAVVAWHGRGAVEFVPFPEALRGRYQPFTRADTRRLRSVGYDRAFRPIEAGVREYLAWLSPGAGPA